MAALTSWNISVPESSPSSYLPAKSSDAMKASASLASEGLTFQARSLVASDINP